jgi:hypothetical protein
VLCVRQQPGRIFWRLLLSSRGRIPPHVVVVVVVVVVCVRAPMWIADKTGGVVVRDAS